MHSRNEEIVEKQNNYIYIYIKKKHFKKFMKSFFNNSIILAKDICVIP